MEFTYNELSSLFGQAMNGIENATIFENAFFDSRQATSNSIFFALDGETTNGVNFIEDAVSNGAKAIIISSNSKDEIQTFPDDISIFCVDDPLLAFGELGKLSREKYEGTVIGVIGSVGKTTTKAMLYEAGGAAPNIHANSGSFNNETGVPYTLCSIPKTSKRAIVELGESNFGDLSYITNFARPNILVITNVGPAHLEFLGDIDGVATTMNEAVSLMEQGSTIVIPADLKKKDIVLRSCKANVVEVVDLTNAVDQGTNSDGFYITQVIQREDLTHQIEVEYKSQKAKCHIPLIGKHFVINTALALCASVIAGDDLETASNNIKNVKPTGHRMRVVEKDNLTLFDDCYNANPVSMKACIDVLSSFSSNQNRRSVIIMGTMAELGENSKAAHEEVIRHAIKANIDSIVCVGPVSKLGFDAVGNASNISYFETVKDCVADLSEIIKEGDVVAVKASRGPDPACPILFPVVEFIEHEF